jgi:predicted membrane-bound mannosyltransferase
MKTKNSNILPLALLTTALLGLMIASGFVISAATAQSNTTATNATTNAATNATTNATTNSTTKTSLSSNDPIVIQIDAAISAINDGKTDEGRKSLFEAEKLMEGKPSIADSEKRVEAAIKALSDGDTNGSVSQAEEAKKSLAS